MHKLKTFFKFYSLPLFAGLFVGTTYVPFPPWALLFAYAPLWIFAFKNRNELKKVFWGGWWTQFILTTIGFYWVYGTAVEFGGLPKPLAFITLLCFSAFIHLYIPLSLVLATAVSKKWNLSAGMTFILIALSHSLFERYWPSVFTWHLGYTLLWQKLPAYQWADTIGFFGLSSLILLFNALFAQSFHNKILGPRNLKSAGIAIFIFLALNFTGAMKVRHLMPPDQTLQILTVQANIGNFDRYYAEKGSAGAQSAILEKFLQQSEYALKNFPSTDLMAWPESAIPEYLDQNYLEKTNPKKLTQFLLDHKIPLITGAFSKDSSIADKDLSVFNGLFLMQQGLPPQVYRKTHLLAFGEYLPLSSYFPILLKWLPFISNFGRGHGPMVMELNTEKHGKVLLGGQICYEGLYDHFSIGLAHLGAQILVNVTNDSWFGKYSEPQQHMIMTLSRAIETRRPLIRVTNTGVTTAIMANGEQLHRSPLYEEWAGLYKIDYQQHPEETIYMKFHPYDSVLLLFIFILLVIYGAKSARPSKP